MIHIKHRWSIETKKKAHELRRKGYSFTQITRELGVVKSTLSLWLKDIPKPFEFQYLNSKDWLAKIRPLGLAANKKINQEKLDKELLNVKEEILKVEIDKNLGKTIVSMLYWAEGAKNPHTILNFANTDPKIMLLFITLLRRHYQIDEGKLRVRLHVHYYHKIKIVKKYWSDLLNIPETRFGKIYHKKRSKEKTYRRNFGGICFLKYNSVYLQREITQYGLILGEKITGPVNIPNVPVA